MGMHTFNCEQNLPNSCNRAPLRSKAMIINLGKRFARSSCRIGNLENSPKPCSSGLELDLGGPALTGLADWVPRANIHRQHSDKLCSTFHAKCMLTQLQQETEKNFQIIKPLCIQSYFPRVVNLWPSYSLETMPSLPVWQQLELTIAY